MSIDKEAWAKLKANKQDELTRCVFQQQSVLTDKEARPLLRTVWKDGIDIEEPSLALEMLAFKIIETYEAAKSTETKEQPVVLPAGYDNWQELIDENTEYERLLAKYMGELESLREREVGSDEE